MITTKGNLNKHNQTYKAEKEIPELKSTVTQTNKITRWATAAVR